MLTDKIVLQGRSNVNLDVHKRDRSGCAPLHVAILSGMQTKLILLGKMLEDEYPAWVQVAWNVWRHYWKLALMCPNCVKGLQFYTWL